VAQVESQVTAISFSKPVIINKLNVVSGQDIKERQLLIEVARPDLDLDIEKKLNEKNQIIDEINRLNQNQKSKLTLLRIETEGRIRKLETEKLEIGIKLSQQQKIANKLNVSSVTDSLLQLKLKAIEQESANRKNYQINESSRMSLLLKMDNKMLLEKLSITDRELNALTEEKDGLIKKAKFDGTIGSVNVQLDELVPPYKTILSIYEKHPTIIKAFMNEKIRYSIKPGDSVRVESENRLYSINGHVMEIGSRITDYPKKLQDVLNTIQYGQEVFIKIPPTNSFLNGEKVFVHYEIQ